MTVKSMIYSNKEYSVFGNLCKKADGDKAYVICARDVCSVSWQYTGSHGVGLPRQDAAGRDLLLRGHVSDCPPRVCDARRLGAHGIGAPPATEPPRLVSSCFFALVFGLFWPTSEGRRTGTPVSAYRNGTRVAKAAADKKA